MKYAPGIGPNPVVFVIHDVNKSLVFEWMAEGLVTEGFPIRFVHLQPQPGYFHQWLTEKGIPSVHIPYATRRQLPGVLWRLWRLFQEWQPRIVHTHLLDAGLAGLTAAWLAGVPHRLYTRHYATMNWEYYPKNVMLDQWCNAKATRIVSISPGVSTVLQDYEGVPAEKITRLPHGFDLPLFAHVPAARTDALRQRYSLPPGNGPVVGAISRFIELKGVQYLIEAFRGILTDYPGAVLFLANAQGDYAPQIQALLATLPPDSFRTVSFESDLPALYTLFDVFVHIPVNPLVEAFGQTYIEALAAQVPCVFTASGIGCQVARHGYNSLVVPFRDAPAVEAAIRQLLQDPALAQRLAAQGQQDVQAEYNLDLYHRRQAALHRNPAAPVLPRV